MRGVSQVTVVGTFDRVFRYNPVTDVIARLLLPGPVAWEWFCPVAHGLEQQALYLAVRHHHGWWARDSQIWEFTPPTTWYRSPLFCLFRWLHTHHDHRQPHLHGGGSNITAGVLTDTTNSFVYNPGANTIGPIAPIRGPPERRGHLTSMAKCS